MGRGKKTCWDVWNSFEPLTQCLLNISEAPTELQQSDFDIIQRYVVLLYSRTSDQHCVNEARRHLFVQGSRSFENIPPSEAALREHCKRGIHQGVFVWGSTLQQCPVLPSPVDWGWKVGDNGFLPVWTTQPDAFKACKKGCRGLCKCRKYDLKCTELCSCQGGCAT